MKETRGKLGGAAMPALVVMLAFLLVFSLRSCRGSPDQAPVQPAGTAAGPGEAPPQEEQGEGELSGGQAVLTFGVYAFMKANYEPLVEDFNRQNPGITVQLRELPETGDLRRIASAADTTLLTFRQPGQGPYFLDLDPLLEGDPSFDPGDFWPGALEACQDAGGRIYGLPVAIDLTGIYYRKEAFDRAGLPYPQPGWTWEDFQQAAHALSGVEDGRPFYGFADDSFIDSSTTLLAPQVGALLEESGGSIEAERFAGELQWYLEAAKAGSLYSGNIYPQRYNYGEEEDHTAWSEAWNESWEKWHSLFGERPPALWKGKLDQIYWRDTDMKAFPEGGVTETSSAGSVLETQPGVGWAPAPVSAAGADQTTPAQASCAVISAGSTTAHAAWAWLKYLSEHPAIPEWSYSLPARVSLGDTLGGWSKIPAEVRPALEFGLEHAWYGSPFEVEAAAVETALFQALEEGTGLQGALGEASSQLSQAPLIPTEIGPIVVDPPDPIQPASETVIDFYPFIYGDRAGLESLAAGFNRLHPEISVKIASPDTPGEPSGLAEGYDCFAWTSAGITPDLALDLAPFLEAEGPGLREDFDPGLLEEFRLDGKLAGLPFSLQPDLVYYNADLLARRGLEAPANDWTYDEFLELIGAAASPGGQDPVYGLALNYYLWPADLFLAGRDLQLADLGADPPRLDFDTPESRDFLQWLAGQAEAKVFYPVNYTEVGPYPSNVSAARQAILDGEVAFWVSWFAGPFGGVYQITEPGFQVGVAPLPAVGNGWSPRFTVLGLYISPNAGEPQACWEWMKFLSDNQAGDSGVPARRSVQESEAWQAQVGPEKAAVYLAALQGRAPAGQANPFTLGPARRWWERVLAEALNGGDPFPLLAEMQAKADRFTACLQGSAAYQTGDEIQRDQVEAGCLEQVDPELR